VALGVEHTTRVTVRRVRSSSLVVWNKTHPLISLRRDYINADFILAGAVDVERLWSKVGNLLVDNRIAISSSMIRTIMILKENRSMWGSTDVFGAIEKVRRREAELHVARCS